MRLSIDNQDALAGWVSDRLGKGRFLPDFKAIGAFDGERLCGAVIYDCITFYDCDLHIVLEDKRCVSRRIIQAIFDYPFKQLGLDRVTAQVTASNAKSLEFIQRLGFTYEGTRRKAVRGEDQLIFGLLKTSCRWIHG